MRVQGGSRRRCFLAPRFTKTVDLEQPRRVQIEKKNEKEKGKNRKREEGVITSHRPTAIVTGAEKILKTEDPQSRRSGREGYGSPISVRGAVGWDGRGL